MDAGRAAPDVSIHPVEAVLPCDAASTLNVTEALMEVEVIYLELLGITRYFPIDRRIGRQITEIIQMINSLDDSFVDP